MSKMVNLKTVFLKTVLEISAVVLILYLAPKDSQGHITPTGALLIAYTGIIVGFVLPRIVSYLRGREARDAIFKITILYATLLAVVTLEYLSGTSIASLRTGEVMLLTLLMGSMASEAIWSKTLKQHRNTF